MSASDQDSGQDHGQSRAQDRAQERAQDRQVALLTIAELVQRHGLSTTEIDAAMGRARNSNSWIRSLLAIVGGLLILAGVAAAMQLLWDELLPAARVAMVFGTGMAALVLALVAVREHRFKPAVTPLVLVAALFQTAGLFVLFDEYPTGFEDASDAMLIFAVMAIQFGSLFAVLKRTELLFLQIAFAYFALAALLDRLGVDAELIGVVIGASGLLVTWGLENTPWRGFGPSAWFVFASCLAIGLFELVDGAFPLDLLLIVLAALLIQLSVVVHSRALLAQGVISMLAYLGYYTREYFADVLGWPVALILFGLVLLALSGYAFKLGQGMSNPSSN